MTRFFFVLNLLCGAFNLAIASTGHHPLNLGIGIVNLGVAFLLTVKS